MLFIAKSKSFLYYETRAPKMIASYFFSSFVNTWKTLSVAAHALLLVFVLTPAFITNFAAYVLGPRVLLFDIRRATTTS